MVRESTNGAIPAQRGRRRSSWDPAGTSFSTGTVPSRGPRRFAPTEHLAPEAIAAFVDGELSTTAQQRALDHIARCPECAGEVTAQSSAQSTLRACCDDVRLPEGLLGQLSEIPTREFDLPPAAPMPRRKSRFRGR